MHWYRETAELKKPRKSPTVNEGMDITDVVKLTQLQIQTLKTLGAKKNYE
ncbi:MAG: hypothetical protein RMX68_002555 [Aulosira sp. ZfuVER01]|nr:hypothetical protein [Aulosira sp. ZfuVER01]MDZ7996581.1 hypothetical protein [Aulosira sp. DedVER01a]MDZ8054492.1 hypothetical protein [Aulosira sp. ZfuCHP01]